MTDQNTKERLARQLAAAQQAYDAISKIPERDTFTPGTVLKWRKVGDPQYYVAVKTGGYWWYSGRNTGVTWDILVSSHFTGPLDFLEVARTWEDATVKPPFEEEEPTLKLGGGAKGGWILRDLRSGVSWERHGNTWERL